MLRSLFRVLSAAIFLAAIIFTIPLAFDVGGRTCGLVFSLSLSIFYFFNSTLRLATPRNSRIGFSVVQAIGLLQWLVVPGLLIWSLNKFSVDSADAQGASWVERTFNRRRAHDTSIHQWLFGPHGFLESVMVGGWDAFLHWSVPVFQLAEGFCSLLVIQAAGQITRWVVNRDGGDNWMVSLSTPRVDSPDQTDV